MVGVDFEGFIHERGTAIGQQAVDPIDQLIETERLAQKIIGPGRQPLKAGLDVLVGAEEKERYGGCPRVAADEAAQLDAIHVRHSDVTDHQLKGRGAKLLKGITPVCGQCNLVSLFLQGLSNGLTNQWLVVNHQDSG
nr:hypothetical protein [Chloracidobacterium sp. D]